MLPVRSVFCGEKSSDMAGALAAALAAAAASVPGAGRRAEAGTSAARCRRTTDMIRYRRGACYFSRSAAHQSCAHALTGRELSACRGSVDGGGA